MKRVWGLAAAFRGCLLVWSVVAATAGAIEREEACEKEFGKQGGGSERSPFLARKAAENVCLHRYFIADKDAPLFAAADGERETPGHLTMGDVFLALEESPDRVLLATRDKDGAVEEFGWANKVDLLENTYKALSLGDGVARGIEVSKGTLRSALKENNQLHLRVVTQPDRKTRILRAPDSDGQSEMVIFSWRWYYIYETETHDGGRTWGLLSDEPIVLRRNADLLDTTEGRFRANFRGWVPLDETTVWATQLELEVNTAPEAVADRRKRRSPAQVLASDYPEEAEVAWKEPLDTWYKGGLVHFDPRGVNRSVSRLTILEPAEEFFAVASAGSRTKDIGSGYVAELKRKLQATIDTMLTFDLVFVIDATGSMVGDIEYTKRIFENTVDEIQRVSSSGGRGEVKLEHLGTMPVHTDMIVNVSIVGFKDVKKVYNKRYRQAGGQYYNTRTYIEPSNLNVNWNRIRTAFDRLLSDTRADDSGREALHDGLIEALDEMNEDSLSRTIVLITDEPGDTRNLRGFIDKMPGFPDQAQADLYGITGRFDSLSAKKARTALFAVFQGQQKCYDDSPDYLCDQAFYDNVREATEEGRVFRDIGNYAGTVRQRRSAQIEEAVSQFFADRKNDVMRRTGAIHSMLIEAEKREGGAKRVFDALPGPTKWAVAQALQRNGLTVDDVAKLNDVIYYQGYVPRAEIAMTGPAGGSIPVAEDDSPLPKWRLRVMLSRSGVRELLSKVEGACATLSSLSEENEDRPPWLKDDEIRPEDKVVRLVLTVIDKVSGRNRYEGSNGERQLHDIANKVTGIREEIIERFESDEKLSEEDKAQTVSSRLGETAELLKFPTHLPLRPGGLLSTDMLELLKKDISWFWGERRRLCSIQDGLENILDNNTVPEDPAMLGTAKPEAKEWFYRLGVTGRVEVAHVPIAYIP